MKQIILLFLFSFKLLGNDLSFLPFHGEFYDYCSDKKNLDWCLKIVKNGSIVDVNQDTVDLIKNQLKNTIINASKLYKIDPSLIISILLAESSVDFIFIDKLQEYLVSSGIVENGDFLGNYYSIGIAQIKTLTANKIEAESSLIENRELRNEKTIANLLLTPSYAVYYAAKIIKDIVNTYKQYGFDISHSPDIVATIYSIGEEESLVKRTIDERRTPKLNFKGLFISYHYQLIQELTNVIKQ